jgi:FKBP-type peptidyl-prolyl cis-trans isomerase
MLRISIISVLLLGLAQTAYAADSKLKSEKQKMGYIVGMQTVMQWKQAGLELNDDEIDLKSFMLAIEDAAAGKENRLTPQEVTTVIQEYQKKAEAKRVEQANKNMEVGKQYLAKNKKQSGVKTTASGLQYKVVSKGKGKQPKPTDKVRVHYEGKLISGKTFDSSYSRNQPAEFPVGGVIKGWQEVLPLMKEGAKWKVFIPSDLAYGVRGTPNIGPNEVLIFDIELLKVM